MTTKKENIHLSKFKHQTSIQVRYVDIDMQGHVNNATFLSYIEQGRVEYFNALFPENDFKATGLILARTEIDYFEPIWLNESIYCYTRIPQIKNKSFVFENVLTSEKGTIKCYAKSIMVCFNYIENTTIPVPTHWRQIIESFENQSR
ncbi:MAG: acyl-CoA thioesterase [Bacteroidia bacterium]|nr:acyl-CoA thioesterase [Bacteroidia bacterium]